MDQPNTNNNNNNIKYSPDGKRLILVDASSFSKLNCKLKFYLHVIEGYTTIQKAADIEFGSALHLYKEHLIITGNQQTATSIAVDYYRELCDSGDLWFKKGKEHLTPEFLRNICSLYYMHYYMDGYEDLEIVKVNDKPIVEHKVIYPLHEAETFRIMLAGTIDALCYNPRIDQYFIVDLKSTSAPSPEDYLKQYEMSTQLWTYMTLIDIFGNENPQSFYGALQGKQLNALIDGIFLNKNLSKIKFKRNLPIPFDEHKAEEYWLSMSNRIASIISAIKLQAECPELMLLPPREGLVTGACVERFSVCPFFEACSTADSANTIKHLLDGQYIKQYYNPLLFGGGKIKPKNETEPKTKQPVEPDGGHLSTSNIVPPIT